jgi:hypothetical protein
MIGNPPLLADVVTAAEFAVAFSDGGYMTNMPLADLTGGQAWVIDTYDGQPLEPSTADRHGCSYRTCTSGSPRSGSAGSC